MTTESTRSDSLIERTESVADEEGAGREMQAANLFDLRRIIGGLFIAYGILMTILGITDSDAEIQKAAGVNINLWAGLGMLAFGALMMAWALWRAPGGAAAARRAAARGRGRGRHVGRRRAGLTLRRGQPADSARHGARRPERE